MKLEGIHLPGERKERVDASKLDSCLKERQTVSVCQPPEGIDEGDYVRIKEGEKLSPLRFKLRRIGNA